MPSARGDDVEALAQWLEQEPATYHAATQAVVVFLIALHALEGYFAIPAWVIATCWKFKAECCRAVRKPMAEFS